MAIKLSTHIIVKYYYITHFCSGHITAIVNSEIKTRVIYFNGIGYTFLGFFISCVMSVEIFNGGISLHKYLY